jgi:hypothetical protein
MHAPGFVALTPPRAVPLAPQARLSRRHGRLLGPLLAAVVRAAPRVRAARARLAERGSRVGRQLAARLPHSRRRLGTR